MNIKPYPIGTKIRWVHPNKDNGKTGTFVGIREGCPLISIPNSCQIYPGTYNGRKYNWQCNWADFEVLKKQQLMFSFMYD